MNFYTINIFNVWQNIFDFWSQYIKWHTLNEEPSKTIQVNNKISFQQRNKFSSSLQLSAARGLTTHVGTCKIV
jgi:hypothetical protein